MKTTLYQFFTFDFIRKLKKFLSDDAEKTSSKGFLVENLTFDEKFKRSSESKGKISEEDSIFKSKFRFTAEISTLNHEIHVFPLGFNGFFDFHLKFSIGFPPNASRTPKGSFSFKYFT